MCQCMCCGSCFFCVEMPLFSVRAHIVCLCAFHVEDADHCMACILEKRYLLSQEKHAGKMTVSPRKIYSLEKEGGRAKLHFTHISR